MRILLCTARNAEVKKKIPDFLFNENIFSSGYFFLFFLESNKTEMIIITTDSK